MAPPSRGPRHRKAAAAVTCRYPPSQRRKWSTHSAGGVGFFISGFKILVVGGAVVVGKNRSMCVIFLEEIKNWTHFYLTGDASKRGPPKKNKTNIVGRRGNRWPMGINELMGTLVMMTRGGPLGLGVGDVINWVNLEGYD